MKNFKYSGQSFEYTVPGGQSVVSGDPVVQGEFSGCVIGDAAENEVVNAQRTGVVEIPKKDTVVFAQGDSVYLEAGEGSDVNTSPLFGYAYKAAAGGDEKILVALKAGAAAFNGM